MATPNIVPRNDSEGQLGTTSKYWAAAYIDAIYVGAGKIGRDTDNNIDFSVDNRITFVAQGSNKLILNSSTLKPAADDGITLGNSGTGWSDLFLASGAVINFDDGNATLTHSNDRLKINDNTELAFGDGQDLKIKHDTSNSTIENSTGNLTISNIADDSDIIFTCDDGSGGVTAYFTLDGSQGFTTVQKNIRFEDGVETSFGLSDDMRIYHSGSAANIRNFTGDLTIEQNTDDGDIIFKSDDGSGGVTAYLTLDGSDAATVISTVKIMMPNLPTSDPGVTGQLWNDSGTLKIS